uniref:26S proteasome complex subunit SEM1 n=1 Tax=Bubo bubo TaxID=30461 RepID=A0A8C0IIB1_BUBBB
ANVSVRHSTKAKQRRIFRPLSLSLDWTGLDEDEDAHVWEDNWDDDNVEDDFSNQAELEKHGYKMETS